MARPPLRAPVVGLVLLLAAAQAALLILSGLSALTSGGAKVITTQKVDAAASTAVAAAQDGTAPAAVPKNVPADQPNLLTDLVQNDNGSADIGDFQMIVVTLIAVVVFGLTAFNFLGTIQLSARVTLPDVDTTLLSGFGLGQAAYLIKKMAAAPGDG